MGVWVTRLVCGNEIVMADVSVMCDHGVQLASINLCPNVVGQIGICLMTNEPQPGDVSHDSWKAEKQGLLDSLRRKAHMMTDFFNSLEGVSCTFTEGAMYSFPLITCAPSPSPAPLPLQPSPAAILPHSRYNPAPILPHTCPPGGRFKQVDPS